MGKSEIKYLTLSQEDFIEAGAFDLKMAISALQQGLFKFKENRILFPDKIVQIFNEETQERINCLPATLLDEKICGVKWVSVFPPRTPAVLVCRTSLSSSFSLRSKRASPSA